MKNKGIFMDVEVPPSFKSEEALKHGLLASQGNLSSQNLLIVHSIRLVMRIINERYSHTYIEDSEILSVGIMGLINAARNYNYQRNKNFATYAGVCIENEILKYLKLKENRHAKKNKSLNELIANGSSIGRNTYYDIIENDKVSIVEEEVLMLLEFQRVLKIITTLEEKEKMVMILRFGLSGLPAMTQEEVAKVLGLYQQQIHRLERRAIKRIKLIIDNEDKHDFINMSNNVSTFQKMSL